MSVEERIKQATCLEDLIVRRMSQNGGWENPSAQARAKHGIKHATVKNKDVLIKRLESGEFESFSALAKELGCSAATVANYAFKLGVKHKQPGQPHRRH